MNVSSSSTIAVSAKNVRYERSRFTSNTSTPSSARFAPAPVNAATTSSASMR
jgi:hypothetical protein